MEESQNPRYYAMDRAALLAEVERLRALIEANSQVPWEADAAGNITDFSQRWLDMTGLTREAALGGGWKQVQHGDDLTAMAAAWSHSVRTGDPYDVEHRIRLVNGDYRWMRSRATARRSPDGEILAWYATTEDVHDRKLAEAALQESEALYRATYEGAAVGIAQVGLDGRWLRFNDALADILGFAREELTGKTFGEVTHPDDLEADLAQLRRLVAGEIDRYGIEKRYIRKDGRTVWASLTVAIRRDADGRPLHFVSVVEDITLRKEAEEDLRRTQESLGLAMKSGRMGWWRRDYVRNEIAWSPELEAIFGLKAGEFDGTVQGFLQFIHPDDIDDYRAIIADSIATGNDYAVEFRFRGIDGAEGWMEGRGKAYYDTAGNPLVSYGIGVDVTERRNAEEALRKSGRSFKSLVQNSPLGVYAVDADFRLVIVSQGAQKVFENVRPLLGRDFAEVLRNIWAEPFASEAIRLFRHTLATGEPYHAPSTVAQRQDLDEVESYDWKIERIALPDGRLGVVCHFYDLSERQRHEAELELRVKERTEELTRANRDLNEFAYSVAHDLRAPLRAIVSTSKILLEDLETRLTDEEREILERQAKSGVRLATIVDDLLGFARLANAELKKSEVDVTALVYTVADDVSHRWERGCVISVREGMTANADASLLGYAFTNLLDNACKFSPAGGSIEVGQQDGAFFVRDQGVGFDMEHAPKLFIAFERLVDQETFPGSGVGLANVKRIVERHGGQVWAESEPGKGATFWFTLG